MNKAYKVIKISGLIIYIIIISIIFIWNRRISEIYGISPVAVSTLFFITMIVISYKYILSLSKKDNIEDEMISIVNHTFRTPLTSIVWYAKELEKDLPLNEKLSHLQNLSNSANKVLGVVDILTGIKNVKNNSSYYFEATSIREIVENSIKKNRDKINKKNLAFQVSIFKDIPLLTLDLKKISFVIDSLVENAIDYTKKEGKILIDCIYNSEKITLYISDTGIGLTMKDKFNIFKKYYRSKQARLINTDGMGLRLYLSKQIVKRHNGKIYAKSNGQDEGTTFFLELPFNK